MAVNAQPAPPYLAACNNAKCPLHRPTVCHTGRCSHTGLSWNAAFGPLGLGPETASGPPVSRVDYPAPLRCIPAKAANSWLTRHARISHMPARRQRHAPAQPFQSHAHHPKSCKLAQSRPPSTTYSLRPTTCDLQRAYLYGPPSIQNLQSGRLWRAQNFETGSEPAQTTSHKSTLLIRGPSRETDFTFTGRRTSHPNSGTTYPRSSSYVAHYESSTGKTTLSSP